MEATALLTLPLLLFLSFTTNRVSATPAVLDSAGNKLQPGEYYYLVPFRPLPYLYTSAVVPSIVRPGTVWLQLETEDFNYNITGLPAKISQVNGEKIIRESSNVNIEYTDELSPVSGGSSVWKVDGFVTLGGVKGDRKSWFKIQKASASGNHIYKLVSSFNWQAGKNDIGISKRNYGAERLALTNESQAFSFRPATTETNASE